MSLERLLRATTVRVEGGTRPGAGFFLAPGLVATCAHVVGTTKEVTIIWGAHGERAAGKTELVLRELGRPIPALDDDYPDIALVRVRAQGHPCVALDEDLPSFGDQFRIYGYPSEGGSVLLTPGALTYRGIKGDAPTEFIDLAADRVKPGMSGAPLLNLRSSRVCGIVVATRNDAQPDGGLAVPWASVLTMLEGAIEANRRFHAQDQTWESVARPSGRRVRFRLPVLAPDFSGRGPELEALERALASQGSALVTQAITGLGGVGKSQLAARYVHHHADEYDVIAWIRAEDGGVADLAELAVELGESVEGLAPPERADRAISWLADCDEHWLLVLDNVVSPERSASRWPTAGNGRLLVTSRRRDLDQFGPTLSIDVFDEETGADYLVARARRPDDRAAARRLSRALGGLPLALSHAGAYCSAGTSFDEYLDLVTELPAAELFDASPEAFYAETVASTWKVSIEAAMERAPLAPNILEMAAFLAADAIPIELFRALVPDASDARARKSMSDAMNALSRFSLIEIDDRRANIHRLLQKTVRDELAAAGSDTPPKTALRAVAAALPDDPKEPAKWPQFEQLVPHASALSNTVPPATGGEELIELLNRVSSYAFHAGDYDRAVGDAEHAHRLAQGLLGPEHPGSLNASAILAALYWSAGRHDKAVALEERVLALREETLGTDDPETSTARNNLALSYQSMGRDEDAIRLGEQVLADRGRTLGEDHPDTLNARANLAGFYWSAGRNDEAMVLEERVLADRERTLGADHPETLMACNNLSGSYWSAGRIDEATSLAERALSGRERILGRDHPATLIARSNVALLYQAAGHLDGAISMGERALADMERVHGVNHPETLTARTNLATSYWRAERRDEAVVLVEQVVGAREQVSGSGHPHTAAARAVLATYYRALGRDADADAVLPLDEDG